MAIQSKGSNRIQRAIDKREPFKQASMSGRWVEYTHDDFGQLDSSWTAELRQSIREWGRAYVVFSYRTPIAWSGGTYWIIPDVHYSVTTSNHQGIVRVAAGSSVVA